MQDTMYADGMVGVLLVAAIIGIVLGLAGYVFYAIAMSTIAQNMGYDKPWLAWLPVANIVLIPILTEDDARDVMRGNFTGIYILSFIAVAALTIVFPVPRIIEFIPTLLFLYGFYLLADRFSDRPNIHMVVAIVTGSVSVPFQLFYLRNREVL